MPREKRHRIYPPILARARDMRHLLTPAEAKLWARLRNRQLDGFKFRRQHIIGRFIPDFYCAQCRLIVEVDGDSHAEPDQAEYDRARTEWLNARGYIVIRFANRDILRDTDVVLGAILTTCKRLGRKSPADAADAIR
jgi:very-short-patch-repair endonuclease